MPIHLNAACEYIGCTVAMGLAFGSESETYGDLLACLRDAGWAVVVSDVLFGDGGAVAVAGVQQRTHLFCPTHEGILQLKPITEDPP